MPPSPLPSDDGCHLCGVVPTVTCALCSPLLFCDACDGIFHRNPARANHKREPVPPAKKECCPICGVLPVDLHCPLCAMRFCLECDGVYHQHPERTGHPRTALTPPRASMSEALLSLFHRISSARVPDQIQARAPPQDLGPDQLLDQQRRASGEESLLLIQHFK
ncbi:unnamed protein product, partial [Boreogadus saida]